MPARKFHFNDDSIGVGFSLFVVTLSKATWKKWQVNFALWAYHYDKIITMLFFYTWTKLYLLIPIQ